MSIQQVINGAWLTGLVLLAFLAVTLISRRTWSKFPLFTAYVLVELVEGVVMYILLRYPVAYSYTYWAFELLGMFLGLGVTYEIFKNLFMSYTALRRLATNVFQVAVVALILVGCIVMYTHSPVAGNPFIAALVVVEEGLRIVEIGLLVSLFLFSGAFGLHWRQHIFGMALGLAVFVTVELAAIALRARLGPTAANLLGLARGFSFDCSLLVWLGYLLAPERVTSKLESPDRGQLEQWNQAVKELIYQ